MTVPVARTPLEAEVYLSLLPCERCGETGTDWEYSARASVDGRVTDQYVGECRTCGADRAATFARAGDTPPEAGAVSRFGGARPSELLDAGQWLAVAGSVEALATMDGTSERDRLTCVEYARDAYREALKFLPPGAESVPESALFSEEGRRAARTEPLSLTRAWIEAQASDAEDWADRLRASAAAEDDDDGDGDGDGGDDDDDGPETLAGDAVDETADLARAHTRLRDELLAVAGAVFPDGTPLVTRDDGRVAVGRAPEAAVEYCVADVAVSIPAPGDGQDPESGAAVGRRWPAAAALTRAAGVLIDRGWSATMRDDEGILRLTGETAQYRLPARYGV